MIQVLIAIIILGQILFWLGIKAEWTRKAVHLVSGVSLIILPYIWGYGFALTIGVLFTLFFIFAERKKVLGSLNIKRESLGASLFPLGVTLAILIGWSKPLAFQSAVLILAISDTFAWLVGGGYKGISAKKVFSVSLLFGFVSFLIFISLGATFGLLTLPFMAAVGVFSLILSFVEYNSYYGSDNLFVPVLVSAFGLLIF